MIYDRLWNNLLAEAFYLQDVISNRENPDCRFRSNVRKVEASSTWTEVKARLEWWWVIRLRSIAYRGAAIVFLAASLCILWSELTFNVEKPVISIVALALRACDNNYAAVQLLSFFTLMYMCLCVYSSLFKIRFFNLYLLIPNHHTDANSLLWFTGYMCKMMAPLCYNYINLASNYAHVENRPGGQGQPSTEHFSVFSEFMGMADLVPFLGTFTDWFPVVILLPAAVELLNMRGRCLGLCGVKNFEDDDREGAEDIEGSGGRGRIVLDSDIEDGKALIAEERSITERSLHSEIGLQSSLMNRARNALGAYTSKYRRPESPESSSGSVTPSPRVRPTSLPSTLRQERDRRIDEILSGRTTPNSVRSAPSMASDGDDDDEPDMKTSLISFGDTMKQKFGGLFSKAVSSVGRPMPSDRVDQQPLRHQQVGATSGGRRVIGRVPNPSAVRQMPGSPIPDTVRSRSPSPNPFIRTNLPWARRDETNNLTGASVSPFTRFEDHNDTR
ncbi:LMBR1 domain-containing protein 2 [Apophysomyces ossiformis]|uniref:LMBR1 domain-containing protein 2 n=1 Tax=Apophysomyces ossiformis TaxID=679940 RepID=A0A8H7BJX3_9FUNG|nr:LMBR1 domain-containing protein 2 [Apophysomyces ossiformis]